MRAEILAPAAVLVLWTLVMLGWLAATRIPAIGGVRGLLRAQPGRRGQDLETVLPARLNWKSHNYTHLTEQPTLFYATSMILALMGAGHIDVALAWTYVALRIVHSLWQALVNRVAVRFALFNLSSACLVVLALRAAMACFATVGH
jgi:hypothetical protein